MQTKKHSICGKILSITLAAGLLVGSSVTANAYSVGSADDIREHSVGIVGSFNEWGNSGQSDVPMNDYDGDGIYEGIVYIDEATEDMVVEATMDDGTGQMVDRGIKGITFKVRLDNSWDDSWGDYEPAYVRTHDSQTNCCVECAVGDKIAIKVKFDTTRNVQQAIDDGEIDADEDPEFYLLPVTYESVDMGYDYTENDDGTITLNGFKSADAAAYYAKKGGTFVFPDNIDGKTVTKIGYPKDLSNTDIDDYSAWNEERERSFQVFIGYDGGVQIQLPDTITEIGDGAFFCPKFVDDKLPEGLQKIGRRSMSHIAADEALVLPSTLKYIGDEAFMETDAKFILNEGLEYIGRRAFVFNPSDVPEEITIPKSVKYLGWDAFSSNAYDPDEHKEMVQRDTTFNIYGGGYVEQYMKNYVPFHREDGVAGYKYNIIGQVDSEPSQTESVNGLKVSGAIPEGAEFKAVSTTTKWLKDPLFCYEISLNKDGAEVQPDGYITIYIPCEYSNGYVLHIDEETGRTENRNSIYVDGYYVFVTDHLSKYGIKFESEPVKTGESLGDVNGDGSADIADALLVARYDAGLAELSDAQQKAADVNHDNSVDIADALMIARYDAKLIDTF